MSTVRIYRRDLKSGRKKRVGGYGELSLFVVTKFMESFAQSEADKRDDVESISSRQVAGCTHLTLMGSRGESLVEYFYWIIGKGQDARGTMKANGV